MAQTQRTAEDKILDAEEKARLEAQIAALRADLAAMAETVKSVVASRGAAFAEMAGAEAVKLRAKGEAAMAGMSDQAGQTVEEARAYVRDNPMTAIGIAAGAGLVFGLLFGRR